MRPILLIALLAGSACAQDNPLPLERTDGSLCFADETCSGPWHEFASRGETGQYCEADEQFCRTEGRGESCACSTGRPSGWVPTGVVSGAVSGGSDPVDYDAEIVEYVAEPCFLATLDHTGTAFDERQALAIMRIMNAAEIDELIAAVRPLVVGEDRETRLGVYVIGAMMCAAGAAGD